MEHQHDYLEVYKEIFDSFMAQHSDAVYKELHLIYDESIQVYTKIIKEGLDAFPGPSGMKEKMDSILEKSRVTGAIPGFLMTEEFYMIKDVVIYKALSKYYSIVFQFCIDKLENEYYICDEAAASKFASSVLDFIQDNMWVDALPSDLELESRKN